MKYSFKQLFKGPFVIQEDPGLDNMKRISVGVAYTEENARYIVACLEKKPEIMATGRLLHDTGYKYLAEAFIFSYTRGPRESEKEKSVQDALIALGWTPPKDDAEGI